MSDRNDDSSQRADSAREGSAKTPDQQADRAQAGSKDDDNAQKAVESRPRGKTEDPDRTL
jgi:hypothetical protein